METTHWADLAENFKIQDAACLMAGVPPAKAMVVWSDQLPPEARYVFERLWKAYMRGAGVYKQPELGSADFQKMLHGIDGNDFRTPTIVPARGAIRRQNMLIAPSAELMRKRLESVRVSREELHRWVKATGIKPAYSFAPVVEMDTVPKQNTAPTAPGVAAVPASDARPDPERRLALLRELGGAAKYSRCEWTFTGIKALVDTEKANGRKRSTEKTIRADLKEAAQIERDAKNAGFAAGLGQR